MVRGKFIVIEGLDGSGKTTITKALAEKFAQPCITTCEPTNGPVGRLLRDFLRGDIALENDAVALLYAADRVEHITKHVIPALETSHVICDRYYYSSMAYQGITPEALGRVASYNQYVMGQIKPDHVFFVNVSPAECSRRIGKRGEEANVYDALPALTLRYERYQAAMASLEDNVYVVGNDTATTDEIVAEMWKVISK